WRWWRQVGGGRDGVALGMVGDGVALGVVAWRRDSHDGGDDVDEGGVGGDGCGGVMVPVDR
ncbi:hypothetical protein Tco_1142334, partial [Tanacetum coccineum]